MNSIVFIEHGGAEHTVGIEPGKTLLQTAMDNGVPGVDGDCGGEGACGTCHVIIEKAWVSATGKADAEEMQMLDLTPERSNTSRLSCQIVTSESMGGMTVRLPEFQM